ncbi:MAG: chemotaxis-specific protein-glutamate methyltransferase CheB [Candidatus Omnitrophica bacterium]|nr:chemotaxis-specific protein-glutamate methyltransferase CheB [Candidatus Omnitrophota bacterium]
MDKKIRVLIVDDSSLMRSAIESILRSDNKIEIVGTAGDGAEAVKKTKILKPDVITMDLKMPIMSGLEAIEKIMRDIPTPIIVVSTVDMEVIVKALGIGAMDFVPVTQDINSISRNLIQKVKIASRVRPIKRIKIRPLKTKKKFKKKKISKIVAIGVSTGGPQALQVVLSKLPQDLPAGILIVQHMAEGFIGGLAEWLKNMSLMDIKVASSKEDLKTGIVFFAPDNYNVGVDEDGVIQLSESVNKSATYVPSIDVMMRSVALSYGENAVGVIMTGMGTDGVKGIAAIKKAGGKTIAQDEESSVIFGMNKVAIDKGYADKVVSLEKIADEIVKAVEE